MSEPTEATAATPAIEMVDATLTSLVDPTRVIAEEVNWSVMPGDYWVVGGLHGVGKSDFLAAAAGILLPTRGTYRLFGKKIEHGFEQELIETRLRLSVVFDGGRLLNHLTLAENIALPMQYHLTLAHDELLARVTELLEAVDLLSLANAHPASLSRNRQQRIGLARAMALRPEALLLDGPLTGLDPTDANWWLEIMDRLAAGHPAMGGRPATLVATAHDFRPWRGHARQFAALRQKHLRLLRPVSTDTEEHLMREIVGKDLD
jgi:ABC-type transporter Mla maintaining outer membrane lipid asymmetry ATPase subunit MlaF